MTTNVTLPAVAAEASPKKSALRHVTTVARILMGLLFLSRAVAFFFNLVPPPKDPRPEGAMAFATAMAKTGFLMQLVKGTELVVGVLLVVNRFVPLALVLIAPVVVNIVAFHVFLAPAAIVTALVVLALEIYLAWAYRAAYRPLLTARSTHS